MTLARLSVRRHDSSQPQNKYYHFCCERIKNAESKNCNKFRLKIKQTYQKNLRKLWTRKITYVIVFPHEISVHYQDSHEPHPVQCFSSEKYQVVGKSPLVHILNPLWFTYISAAFLEKSLINTGNEKASSKNSLCPFGIY